MRLGHGLWGVLIGFALAAFAGIGGQAAYPTPGDVAADTRAEAVEFNRDIRPILSDNCYACHGPDKNKRKAELRLDQEESARADRGGYRALVPEKPEESELFLRITAEAATERMPPKSFGKKLSPQQVAIIKKWIEQGAKWQNHWSLIVPQRPALPPMPGGEKNRIQNGIDRFIAARLEKEGLKPAAEADQRTLLRRLSFDLIGLPPTPEEVDAFVADSAPDAYEKQVDRLLASPHFGERMAMFWLDLVRYADSIGYHSDNPRNIAPYRDYVIEAFNENKPFDRFTIEQLAGDLLPNSTMWQKVASGYNRLLQTTEEGGAQPKEYAAKYMADRVRNAGSAWLGLTLGCAECHDHKFDPVSTRDFYSFAAFFADVQEAPVGRREPGMLVPTADQAEQLKQLDRELAEARKKLQTPKTELAVPSTLQQAPLIPFDPAFPDFAKAAHAHDRHLKSIRRSLVSVSAKPRDVRILPRGNWLDDSGEVVPPAVPHFLKPLEIKDRRATRLDLARWLVSGDNPLTARVLVNRLWKLYFGQGLARSMEDFGAQGEWPTHPELLDWLAVEFMSPSAANGKPAQAWDVKHMIKLMVMSHTYRQSSVASKQLRERDPDNRLLARQARFRLDAEMVRDNALAVSGLLVRQIGGESVKPYQPAGYWEYLNFPRRTYEHDHGHSQYRRGLYTHWQRTFLHPSMAAFDAPTREECTADRPRSNIPQQALVLLNDPTYVEAARVFAARIVKEGGAGTPERLTWAYRQALARKPSAQETQVLNELLEKHLQAYQADQKAAGQVIRTGEKPVPKELELAELAAWTSVARAILNLHETITRE
jgi:hypothetical protein